MSLGRSRSMRIGMVVRRAPGVTRWAKWSWTVTSVLPGAGDADWRLLRRDGDIEEYHAATLELELHATEAEAYHVNLSDTVPSVYVVMRTTGGERSLSFARVTVSPYEAQDYCDSGEEIVEKVPMPEGLAAWVREFTLPNHEFEPHVKRRRDRKRVDLVEDGIGDSRIRQMADVYRAPGSKGSSR